MIQKKKGVKNATGNKSHKRTKRVWKRKKKKREQNGVSLDLDERKEGWEHTRINGIWDAYRAKAQAWEKLLFFLGF
jgi:hypothetical protein